MNSIFCNADGVCVAWNKKQKQGNNGYELWYLAKREWRLKESSLSRITFILNAVKQ
jgi:hypothetical protein